MVNFFLPKIADSQFSYFLCSSNQMFLRVYYLLLYSLAQYLKNVIIMLLYFLFDYSISKKKDILFSSERACLFEWHKAFSFLLFFISINIFLIVSQSHTAWCHFISLMTRPLFLNYLYHIRWMPHHKTYILFISKHVYHQPAPTQQLVCPELSFSLLSRPPFKLCCFSLYTLLLLYMQKASQSVYIYMQ